MEFKLKRTIVRSLRLEHVSDEPASDEQLFFKPSYREGEEHEFVVNYRLKTWLNPGSALLEVHFLAVFETLHPISDEFKDSHFPRVNAAAVGYPYLRALVTQLSVLAGFSPHILPVRNFIKSATPPQPSSEDPDTPSQD